jgi:hypothetical protein
VTGGRGPLRRTLFDREFTSIRVFVEREPLQALSVGPALIAALNEAGRRAEAEDLARRLLARLDLEVKNGAWATNAAVPRATILATIGRRDEALALLETVARENWALLLWLPYQRLADSVAWRGLAGDPRLTAVQAQLDAKMNAQRAIVGLPPLKN